MKEKEKTPSSSTIDTPPHGGILRDCGTNIVDVALDSPLIRESGMPYTPPPEDYETVVEASLGVPVSKLGVLAATEVERIYYDGLCGGARGYTKKTIPFNNWICYVVKCLSTAYKSGLLRGCRAPRAVFVK